MVSFSVITPTVGRKSIAATAASIVSQDIQRDDEWIIVEDGRERIAWQHLSTFYPNAPIYIRYFDTEKTHYFGNEQRNHAMGNARGSHLLFMDDDDTFTEGVWKRVREECEATPTVPLLFRMGGKDGGMLWKSQALVACEIGTPCLVMPNVPVKTKWGPGAGTSDFEFIKGVCEEIGPPRFVDERICWVKGGLEC